MSHERTSKLWRADPAAIEVALEAFRLMTEGLSVRGVAARAGVSVGVAHKRVARGRQLVVEYEAMATSERRAEHRARLVAVYSRAMEDRDHPSALRAVKQMMALDGTAAPARVTVSASGGGVALPAVRELAGVVPEG